MPPPTKLLTRSAALAFLADYGIKPTTFDQWRVNKDLRPVRLPGNRWEHYRPADLHRLANPPTNTTTP
jgi:hypothetical protein